MVLYEIVLSTVLVEASQVLAKAIGYSYNTDWLELILYLQKINFLSVIWMSCVYFLIFFQSDSM